MSGKLHRIPNCRTKLFRHRTKQIGVRGRCTHVNSQMSMLFIVVFAQKPNKSSTPTIYTYKRMPYAHRICRRTRCQETRIWNSRLPKPLPRSTPIPPLLQKQRLNIHTHHRTNTRIRQNMARRPQSPTIIRHRSHQRTIRPLVRSRQRKNHHTRIITHPTRLPRRLPTPQRIHRHPHRRQPPPRTAQTTSSKDHKFLRKRYQWKKGSIWNKKTTSNT